ncbi:hypothetical protein SPRG_05898 [Saprolegnia parasitica CBS 223.65]|uniref:Beta-lactamase-related domain-containing protein n=1 Tax=Saprolegnia parasitica (strain CBS 223.65) TaxID=695850 RepID=A0A067CRC5_SAPPC|nr:hypothetical protein SPRG_05898 [Saprolegnia parasitica CBS 223.65]KDO29362.1 hypothetical protein SPRG_05898 [Saprolegnia parasitica CBS 223.65]|eukprot:XP_012199865.1 hypothetical protein SPRG_05898 [Saprolegnia parasitica CBS 223.65]
MQRLISAYATFLGIPFGPELASMVAGPSTSQAAKVADAVAFIEAQRERFSYPGLALAVVQGNETLIARGFGTKQVGVDTDPVDGDTLFEIGSVSKTHVAVALAKLVDDGKLQWRDTVKQHLPWFTLQDKYAEEVTTIGDLASHNSVFGNHEGDEPQMMGVVQSEREGVERLRYMNTTRKVRPGFAYSNVGFNVLGQVIEAVSGSHWSKYLTNEIWQPWGMTSTYGSAADAPSSHLTHGHYVCSGTVIGPYALQSSPLAKLSPNVPMLAAGSIVSSINDMATFLKRILAKGGSNFKSPQSIETLISGHNLLDLPVPAMVINTMEMNGLQANLDGDGIMVGYGIDFLGNLLFGERYAMKNGATKVCTSTTAYVPARGLGLVLLANKASVGGQARDAALLELMRSYVLGLFLDIPKKTLNEAFEAGLASAKIVPDTPCDAHYFGKQPLPQSNGTVPSTSVLPGTYLFEVSPDYYGPVNISLRHDQLHLTYGAIDVDLVATSATEFLLPYDFMPTQLTLSFDVSAKPSFDFLGKRVVQV